MEVPFGYCQCGCGEKTNIITMTATRKGYIAGLPYPYLVNHRKRMRGEFIDAKPFKIDGVYCRLIKLTQGMYTIIHASRYAELSKHKWHARKRANAIGYYVQRNSYQVGGKRRMIHMHRVIFGIPDNDPNRVDHRDMNTLDNRDENLRYATPAQNAWNQGISKRNTSGYKGVSWSKATHKWSAIIRNGKRSVFLGYFKTAYKAHLAYCEAANRFHGDFARTM